MKMSEIFRRFIVTRQRKYEKEQEHIEIEFTQCKTERQNKDYQF